MANYLKKYTWKEHGLGFGVITYIINVFALPSLADYSITTESILLFIPISILGGFLFGKFMQWNLRAKE